MKKWVRLPTRSRVKCREMVFEMKRKHLWIVRCKKRATWNYGKLFYGHRCDEHKEHNEKLAKAAAETMEKVLK